jgi:hypothetical protein
MNFILNHSQYKHECELEQHREDAQMYSSKLYDRHTDNSLLGSVRRRFIAPKLRAQHSTTPPPPAAIIVSGSAPGANSMHESKSKTRSMTMDLKRSSSKESMATNGNHHGKMISMFSLSKVKIIWKIKRNCFFYSELVESQPSDREIECQSFIIRCRKCRFIILKVIFKYIFLNFNVESF